MIRTVRIVLTLIGSIVCSDAHLFTKYSESILPDERFINTLNLIEPKNLIENYKEIKNNGFNDECARDLDILKEALIKREIWALKMMDASSKIPSGLLEGNIIDLGMFDECINVHSKSSAVEIHGHHCMYSINVQKGDATLPRNPSLSICLPTTCTSDDIANLVNNILPKNNQTNDLEIEFATTSCTKHDTTIWDTGFIFAMSFLLSIAGFLFFCTVCDLMIEKHSDSCTHENTCMKTLAEFSLIKSAKNILKLESKDHFPVVHGMRVVSAIWVIFGHECGQRLCSIHSNTMYFVEQTQVWTAVFASYGQFTVDTFFSFSGFFMTYFYLKHMGSGKKFNISTFYLHRYIRMTPGVAIVLVFVIFIIGKSASGPIWDNIILNNTVNPCRTKWWYHLLHINNVVDAHTMCLPYLWYVAVDMQLFWLSSLILYPLYKKPKLGLTILSLFLIISWVIQVSVMAIKKLPVASVYHVTDYSVALDSFVSIYSTSHLHAAPWIIGMYMGYEVANHDRKLKKWTAVMGWTLATLGFSFCFFGLRYFMRPNYVYDVILETAFVMISRSIWSLSVNWIVYASIKGYAGPISSFLSWRIFLPLSKLSYSLYLVHSLIQFYKYGLQKTPFHHSAFDVASSFTSTLVMTIVIAFIFSLMFESPFIVLEKILFHGRGSSQESRKITENGVAGQTTVQNGKKID